MDLTTKSRIFIGAMFSAAAVAFALIAPGESILAVGAFAIGVVFLTTNCTARRS